MPMPGVADDIMPDEVTLMLRAAMLSYAIFAPLLLMLLRAMLCLRVCYAYAAYDDIAPITAALLMR